MRWNFFGNTFDKNFYNVYREVKNEIGGEGMDLDMELVYGDEDYEELQEYFEHRKFSYPTEELNMTDRLRREYVPDFMEVEEREEEKCKINNRQRTIGRIQGLLQKVSSSES